MLKNDLCLNPVLHVVGRRLQAGYGIGLFALGVDIAHIRGEFQVVLVEVLGHRTDHFSLEVVGHIAIRIVVGVTNGRFQLGQDHISCLGIEALGAEQFFGSLVFSLSQQVFTLYG
jgi:hypothetical protein